MLHLQQDHASNHESKPRQPPERERFAKEPPTSKGQQHSGNPHPQGKDDGQFGTPSQHRKDNQRQAIYYRPDAKSQPMIGFGPPFDR